MILPRRALPTALLALLPALAACCPAPLAAPEAPGTVLVGVVAEGGGPEGGDPAGGGASAWVTAEGGARVAVRPPLEQPPGTIVYLRGRWEGAVFVVGEASAVLDPP